MKLTPLFVGAFTLALAASASAETLTIATVNNGDMIRMQGLTAAFTEANPDIDARTGSCWKKTPCASASPPTSPPMAASMTS